MPTRAFTTTYDGISNILSSVVQVAPAFDLSTGAPPPTCQFNAIWDTGATHTAVSKNVVTQCGLKPISLRKVHTANGTINSPVYLVSIGLPNKVGIPSLSVTEANLIGADVLIGMDIIVNGDLAITNHDGKTAFSFRMPSAERIDFVSQIKAKNEATVGRNDLCPCGSGKKFKKCHGSSV
jgi:hypothetical protein